ncbi:MAG: pyrophosphohydrolase [Acidimicrobiaceae bacterium]|jgi:NTP pyrophosphatase (non-canonical NTP hydrolase)|nr:pyrophosphohydrolase [Acidimicrobiaceae bacterium]|tara:strand:+ start:83768 stop:84019 length:252 start_codon:yes stop_codon:yes gene_type:complete
MKISEFQTHIENVYGDKDRKRGVAMSVAWLAEEVGELAQAIRKGTHDERVHEFGDVIAWVFSLANQVGVDIDVAIERYITDPP